MTLREEAGAIIEYAISKVQPRIAVERALENLGEVQGRLVVIAIGKAAWQMGKAAADLLGNKITQGIVITKYGNSKGPIPGLEIFEAGHPIPDRNSFDATRKAVKLTEGLTDKDLVLMLISGGGSALFELPLCAEESLIDITRQLLCCGAEVGEINTVRKRLSAVKGGRFARLCEPASVYSVIMSDLLGDPLDMIASGPTVPDEGTCDMAEEVVKKYNLFLTEDIQQLLKKETPKICENERAVVTGSVRNPSGLYRQRISGKPYFHGLYHRRGNSSYAYRQRDRRKKPGTGAGSGQRNQRPERYSCFFRWFRRHRRAYGRSRRLCRRRNLCKASGRRIFGKQFPFAK